MRIRYAFALFAAIVAMAPLVSVIWAGEAQASSTEPALTWLAAGDSYSSGNGLPHSTGACARANGQSSSAWAQMANKDLSKSHQFPSYATPDLAACTGAKTTQMINAPDAMGTPEWTSGMGRFDLVTFTFGGDNIGFSSIVEQCAGLDLSINALAAAARVPLRVSTLPTDPNHTCPSTAIVRGRIKTLGTTYRAFLKQVAQRVVVPGGNIVVLGYPDFIELPKFWATWEQKLGVCWGIGTGDATELRGLAGDLDATIGSAVAAVNAQAPDGVHLTYVTVNTANDGNSSSDQDLFEPSLGPRHNLCASQPWLNGFTTIHYGFGSFHPNQTGQNAEGQLAATAIRKLSWTYLSPSWHTNLRATPAAEGLTSVSCAHDGFCMAVGTDPTLTPNGPPTGGFSDVAYELDDGSWRPAGTPAAVAATPGIGSLTDVSCASSTMCLASDWGVASTFQNHASVIAWNGTSWSNTGLSLPNQEVDALQCLSSTWCMAIVGPGPPVASTGPVSSEIWNGTSWSSATLPSLSPPGGTALSLSCASTTFCMVSSTLDGEIMDSSLSPTHDNATLAWNGTSWAKVPWPTSHVALGPLDCPADNSCLQLATAAKGSLNYGKGSEQFVYAEGSWSRRSGLVLQASSALSLSCSSTTSCVAVGGTSDGGVASQTTAVAEYFDSTRWLPTEWSNTQSVRTPTSISCTASQCVLVGTGSASLPFR